MRLCLTCLHLSRAGSIYCGSCGRSFGVRLCGNKHANAPHVHFCTTCASSSLSEPTRFLRLGWVSAGLSVLALLTAWRWILAHLGAVAAGAWAAASWILAVLLGTSFCAVDHGVRAALALLIAGWILGHFLTLLPEGGGTVGRGLRAAPASVLKWALLATGRLARLGGRGLRRLLLPPPRKSSGKSKKDV